MIYFDNAATTAPCEQAKRAAIAAMDEYANPSSAHKSGIAARRIAESARESVAKALGCTQKELVFTSCGSEANNQALFGLARLRARRGKRIITTAGEHPSVYETLKILEERGFEVIELPVTNGEIDLNSLKEALSEPVAFVTVMHANNETGALYDIAAVKKTMLFAGCDAPLHSDAVQSFLKTENRFSLCSVCDAISVSAHKVNGLKGCGALYIKDGLRIPPLIYGGGQENTRRSGTENLPAIAAFGAAVEADRSKDYKKTQELRELLISLLKDEVRINTPKSYLPNILSVSVSGVRSEVLLNYLSQRDICVSAGSACSAHKKNDGRVLSAFGLTKEEIMSTVRISIGENNNEEECYILASSVKAACSELRAK